MKTIPIKEKKKISDNVKAGFLRWWFAGVCYYFIAFGTQFGVLQNPLDLIFFLGIGIGLVMVFVYNPIAYRMFNIERRGEIINKSYYERNVWQNAGYRLLEIFKNLFIVWIVYITYQNLNQLLNEIFNLSQETVLIPGEPFGFATLYIIYYYILLRLADMIHTVKDKIGGKDCE